jgi:hypothetical protein
MSYRIVYLIRHHQLQSLPIGEPTIKDWSDANKIVLRSEEQLKQLISDGYEIIGMNAHYRIDIGGYLDLRLKKADSKIVANANSIFEYASHLVNVYDIEKKKPAFVWVSDTSVYWQFEEALLMLEQNENNQKIITTKKLRTSIPNKVYRSLMTWIDNEKNRPYGIKKLSEIFSLICIVEEKDGSLNRRTFSKEELTLTQIAGIISNVYNRIMSLPPEERPMQKPIRKVEQSGDIILAYYPELAKSWGGGFQSWEEFQKYTEVEDLRADAEFEMSRGR